MADDDSDQGMGGVTEHARPRKRTKRACDKCSSSRTRCNGEYPCGRCAEYGYTCRYNRQVKKRGRLPASNSASVAAAQSAKPRESFDGSSPPLPSPVEESAPSRPPISAISEESPSQYLTPGYDGDTHQPQRRPSIAPQRSAASMSVGSLLHHTLQPEPSHSVSYSEEAIAADDHSSTSPSKPIILNEHQQHPPQHRASFHSTVSHDRRRVRESFSTVGYEERMQDYLLKAPTEDCRYAFLNPVLPYIRNIIPASVACDLLDIFLTDPGSSLFRGASPYILTRIFRKKSILHPTSPRQTTPALLATILWCVAQTADVMLLHVPGTRAKIVNELYDLATSLVSQRDPDRWRRTHGGLSSEQELPHPRLPNSSIIPHTTTANEPAGSVDDVFTFILLSIAVSGGDFKSDCYKWWSKATRLSSSLRLNREDERCTAPVSPCANPLCSCHKDQEPLTLQNLENREERRRVFWLLYSLDRHLSLSFNTIVSIPDSYCEVLSPLPESVWEDLDMMPLGELPRRMVGPPIIATGTAFFEYFLPLMAILGDIIEIHHRRRHPRFGHIEDSASVTVVSKLLEDYELSLETLTTESPLTGYSTSPIALLANGEPNPLVPDLQRARLVKAYSTHILHVLHVLLHGKWDAISMLDDGDDWITSKRFGECASHAISASQSVSTILNIDPELTFMSYLFGIYLLQGSFILLLFADRMPQLGLNESVEQACENIIRAHEVCVVTLSTEFQKNFRRVVRSTLYSVRGAGTPNWEEHKARRRALSLYRWTKGAKGLAL